MTATRPYIFKKGELIELADKLEKYFESLNRVQYDFDISKKSFNDFKDEFLEKVLHTEDQDLMLVLNTISSSKEMYQYLKEQLDERKSSPKLDSNGICRFSNT